jgi:molecular chaperone IbpA
MQNLIDQLFRDAIGYDVLAKFSDTLQGTKYPPHNIVKVGEKYMLTLAVAGFSRSELTVTIEDGHLVVKGARSRDEDTTNHEMLYQGLAFRDFERSWKMGEYVEVTSVTLADGLLTVTMEQNIPESKKARTIDIL